ncbi:MAG: Ferritin BfrB [Phycisphaerae bacterium]|nr:Ferritin BfrB [Phycisphaerae bacterium]
MISDAMNALLNEQVTHEFGASQAYLAMACKFDQMALKNLASYFRKQTEEERGHALKLLDYVLEVGGRVTLKAIPAPQHEFPTVKAAIEAALAHENRVTQQIHELVVLAEKEKDFATRSFLQWFVDEQVEEVSSMSHLVQLAELAGPNLLQLEAVVVRATEND